MALTIAHMSTHLQNSEKHVRTFLLSSVWLREVIKVANAFAVLARRGTNKDGGLGDDPTTEFVLGTRAYSAHICLHVNATASHAIAPSYASLIKTFD